MTAAASRCSRPACRCPACVAGAIVTLLENDRPQMALQVARGLPEVIREAVAAARDAGVREGRRTRPATAGASGLRPQPSRERAMPRKPAPATAKPGFLDQAAELARQIERLGEARVAELLALRPSDLPPLLAGRTSVSWSSLRRLRRTE